MSLKSPTATVGNLCIAGLACGFRLALEHVEFHVRRFSFNQHFSCVWFSFWHKYKMTHEFQAIDALFRQRVPFCQPTTELSNGDDASVHGIPKGMALVVSTDTAVQGVHWPEDMPLPVAAQRAVCAALSDLAAMGAQAQWIWLSVVAKDMQALQAMSDGVVEICHRFQLELAGGDTVAAPLNMLNVTVGGLVKQGQAMARNQAKVGDDIWLLGDLGLSAQGLQQWLKNEQHGDCVTDFQHITPRLVEGLALQAMGVRCCIDVSDGLMQDASHIAEASQVLMCIQQDMLEALPCYKKSSNLQNMLAGGEDYALLCTASPHLRQALAELDAQCIGVCEVGNEVQLMQNNQPVLYQAQGFKHFE